MSIEFNKEKIYVNGTGRPYDINYILFSSEEDCNRITRKALGRIPKREYKRQACFGSLRSLCGQNVANPEYNKMLFLCKFGLHKKFELSKKEIRHWLSLCIEEKMLCEINLEHFLETGEVCFPIVGIPRPQLYLYLCVIRHIQENPWFVRAVLYMIDDLGMGFFTSIAVASKFCIPNTGHHFIEVGRYDGESPPSLTAKRFHLTASKRLFKYVNKMDGLEELGGFGLQSVQNKIKIGAHVVVERDDLAKEETEAAIKTMID